MEYRTLGKTGLKVSTLGFGCGNVGGLMIRGGSADRTRAVARAVEVGINYFDTAPSYGDGESERNLGQALKAVGAPVHVGTKVGLAPAELGDLAGGITRSVEASLARLGLDAVDLIQLHNRITRERDSRSASLRVDDVLGEVVPAFERLQRAGKVRFYGITGLGETPALHQVVDAGVLHTVQVCYNLLNPSAGRAVPAGFPAQDFGRLIERAGARGLGCIGIRVLAAGALSGVVERHPVAAPSVEPIASGADYRTDVRRAGGLGFLVGEGHARSLVEAAFRFAWSQTGLATVLVGFSSLEHLEQAVTYAERGPLAAGAFERLAWAWERFASA